MSHLRLMKSNDTAIMDGVHELYVYNVSQHTVYSECVMLITLYIIEMSFLLQKCTIRTCAILVLACALHVYISTIMGSMYCYY